MAIAGTAGFGSAAIQFKQAEHLYRSVLFPPLFNVATAGVLATLLWGVSDHYYILIWLGLLTLLNGGRMALAWWYQHLPSQTLKHPLWVTLFVAVAALSGIAWGSAAVLVPVELLEYQVLVLLLAGVIAVSALPTLSVVRGAFTLYLAAIVLPVTIRVLLAEDAIHLGIGVVSLLFVAVTYLTGRDICRTVTEAFRNEIALEKLAHSDALTKVANRRHFDEYLQNEWNYASRGHSTLTLIILDIDDFKRYNDGYGHSRGDKCLQRVADALQGALPRSTDLLARYGGEEFVAVLPFTDAEGGQMVAERLRGAVVSLRIPHRHASHGATVTISVGGATCLPRRHMSPIRLIESADRALFEAKRLGKDCTRWRDWQSHGIDPEPAGEASAARVATPPGEPAHLAQDAETKPESQPG